MVHSNKPDGKAESQRIRSVGFFRISMKQAIKLGVYLFEETKLI
ncbi:hypothetical protein [Paenibacillus sp.]